MQDFMSFEDFCEEVRREVSEHLGREVMLKEMLLNNNVKLMVLLINDENSNVSPTIYLDYYYRLFLDKGFNTTVEKIISTYFDNRLGYDIDTSFFYDYQKVKWKVRAQVISYEKNELLLKDVPHRKFLDLAVVYRVEYYNEYIGTGSILVHNNHLEIWGVDEQTLYNDSLLNNKNKYEICSMVDLLKEMAGKSIELDWIEDSEVYKMLVISTKDRVNGASAILFNDVLKEAAGHIGSERLYLIPSSIHELIVLGCDSNMDNDYIVEMISSVNNDVLDEKEILSNSLYQYDAVTDLVTIIA